MHLQQARYLENYVIYTTADILIYTLTMKHLDTYYFDLSRTSNNCYYNGVS